MSTSFSGAGHVYLVTFRNSQDQIVFMVELDFDESGKRLTYTGIRTDGSRGESETVDIRATYLRDNLFLVTWQEKNGTFVTHVEDFENSVIYSNFKEDGTAYELKGTMEILR
jgi:hypothetical protein